MLSLLPTPSVSKIARLDWCDPGRGQVFATGTKTDEQKDHLEDEWQK